MSKKQPFLSYYGYKCSVFIDIEGFFTLLYFCIHYHQCLIDSHWNILSSPWLIFYILFSDPSSEKPSVSRSCQLRQDQEKHNLKKPLSMSQLMQWKHFSGQHQALPDPFLEKIKENVSFFFQNVTNPTSPTQ